MREDSRPSNPKRKPYRYSENVIEAFKAEPNVGQFHEAVRLFRSDPAAAVAGLEALAERGSLLSMVCLGDTYFYGSKVETDLELGKKWMRRAADNGSVEGAFRLSRFFAEREEYLQCVAVLRELVDRQYAPAMYVLGWLYYRGKGVRADEDQALKYWEMADSAGHLVARQMLAWFYRKERRGIESKIYGYWKLLTSIGPNVWLHMRHPNSDRIRTWTS